MKSDDSRNRRRLLKAIATGGAAAMAGCLGGGGSTGGGNASGGGGNATGGSTSRGNQSSGSVKFVHIESFANDMQSLGPMFSKQFSNISLEATGTPAASSTTRRYFINQFVSQSSSFDAGMMDVIWPAEFVQNDWVTQVSDPNNRTEKMLDTPVEAATINDTLYGMPLFTDANAFFYRSDKLEEYGHNVPKTYMEVVNVAQDILKKDDEIKNGYIWQGGTNEGLTIMWLNWLWGMGGKVTQDDRLKVNTKKGIKALEHAVSLIHEYNVTPQSVPASGTDGNRQTFQQGNTLFMRMWPYAVSVMNEDGSAVKGKFDVAPMPKQKGNSSANNSCLGGWSIFINKFSQNKKAAQQFAQFAASKEAQKALAVKHSRLPVRKDLYTEKYYKQASQLKNFEKVLQQTSTRPATPQYSTFSEIVYTECNKALVQSKSPKQALNDAQSEIDSEVNNA